MRNLTPESRTHAATKVLSAILISVSLSALLLDSAAQLPVAAEANKEHSGRKMWREDLWPVMWRHANKRSVEQQAARWFSG